MLIGVLSCGCSRYRHIDAAISDLTVSEKTFSTITIGESIGKARDTLGIAARHEFTVLEPDGEYSLICCYFSGGDSFFWLLFRDRTLLKIIAPFSFPELVETYPYEGTTATRLKSWDIDDPGVNVRIRRVIDSPALTRDQIHDCFHQDTNTTSWNVFPAFLLSGYLWKAAPQMEKDYETTERLFKQYDGCQAELGMRTEDTEKLYGKPKRIFTAKNGDIAQIYGGVQELQVNPQLAFTGMVVVSDKNGRAKAIYSHMFFNDEWIEK